MDNSRLPCLKASKGLFNTSMGPLQRQLRSGEYNLFKFASMFESDFVQVSKRGGTPDVHNQVQLVRVAIAATSPGLQVPNVLLLARPVPSSEEQPPSFHDSFRQSSRKMKFELTRLLPLCFVKISIHDLEKQQLRFKMATGRTFYLQLFPQQEAQTNVFESWVRIIHLLRPPAGSRPEKKAPAKDLLKAGEPVIHVLGTATPPGPEEGGDTTPGEDSTIAEIISIFQEDMEGLPNPAETSESQSSSGQELPSSPPPPIHQEDAKPESPSPSEGPFSREKPKRAPSESGGRKEKPKGHSSRNRKKSPTSKSRRSHSAQTAATKSSSKISTLLANSFGSTSQTHRKGPSKSKEKKR